MVVGPLDYRITPSTGFVRDLLTGRMPLWPGGYNYIAVEDVAKAHVLAADKGLPGERYLAAGYNRTMEQAAEALRKLTGHGSTRHVPPWLLYGAAAVSGALAAVTGGRPLVDRDMLDETVRKWAFFDNTKARTALGWEPKSYEDTLRETVRWLIARKELPDDLTAELKDRFSPDPAWAS
jgi:dihydroflavonol-4-reductase